MRFIGILTTLAFIGYGISIYLDSGDLNSVDPDQIISKSKELIDDSKQAVEDINETVQEYKKKLDDLK